MLAVRPLVMSAAISGLASGTANTWRAATTAHSAKPPYVIVHTGCPTTTLLTSGAAAATTPTASNPASKGSFASAEAVLPKYLRSKRGKAGGREERQMGG
jgi:hypothetical protein